MNISKVILAALIGAIVTFLSGWLIYGILLADMMKESMTPEAYALNKTEPNLIGIFVSNCLFAFLFAYILEKFKVRTLGSGAIAGAIIGGLMTASIDVQFWSMLNMYSSTTFLFVDVLCGTFMGLLAGAAIGWVLGFNRKD